MTTRAEVVAFVRTLMGTPFAHQLRIPGVGMDCVGVGLLPGNEFGFLPNLRIDDYSRAPDEHLMLRLLEEHLDPVPFKGLLPADIIRLYAPRPVHLAVVTEVEPVMRMVHAWNKPRIERVVESPVDRYWRHGRIKDCWRYRGVE